MRSMPMKEIRIPNQLNREEREGRRAERPESLSGVFLRATYAAVICGVMSFFVLTALSIATLAVYGVLTHRIPTFPVAYRYVGAPGALVVLVVGWIYAFIVFRRQVRRGT
jgi:hypothetical protein